ncbi:MAG: hypothetical protein CMN32_08845 [Saprospirales bacterium]|nr:hypothetical protein [Saprospirales bacterium]
MVLPKGNGVVKKTFYQRIVPKKKLPTAMDATNLLWLPMHGTVVLPTNKNKIEPGEWLREVERNLERFE